MATKVKLIPPFGEKPSDILPYGGWLYSRVSFYQRGGLYFGDATVGYRLQATGYKAVQLATGNPEIQG